MLQTRIPHWIKINLISIHMQCITAKASSNPTYTIECTLFHKPRELERSMIPIAKSVAKKCDSIYPQLR